MTQENKQEISIQENTKARPQREKREKSKKVPNVK
jgi:hypothetical protein